MQCTVVLRLKDKNPVRNLAVEEILLDNYALLQQYLINKRLLERESIERDDTFIVLTYVNQASLILGNNQNAFLEIDLVQYFSNLKRIPVYRRISGGGTVFHDENNLNFSFIGKKSLAYATNYAFFLDPIRKFLREWGVTTTLRQSDLLVSGYKISGNAQVLRRQTMLHHGTLLWNADLTKASLLATVSPYFCSRSIASRRSPITNVSNYVYPDKQKYKLENFRRALEDSLANRQIDFELDDFLSFIGKATLFDEYLAKYLTATWIWRRGANFSYHRAWSKSELYQLIQHPVNGVWITKIFNRVMSKSSIFNQETITTLSSEQNIEMAENLLERLLFNLDYEQTVIIDTEVRQGIVVSCDVTVADAGNQSHSVLKSILKSLGQSSVGLDLVELIMENS